MIDWVRAVAIQGINVRDAVENEFPFIVAISEVNNDINPALSNLRNFCVGTLISRKHVLTAEHCLVSKKLHEVELLVGCAHLDQCKAYEPEKWITWRQWKFHNSTLYPRFYHDVAIITVAHQNNINLYTH